MKHCILVKWIPEIKNKKELLPDIHSIFDKLLILDGIYNVKIYENIVDRSNRFDLLICIEMEKSVLPIYDESEPHRLWKEKYGKFVEKKAVFDFEE